MTTTAPLRPDEFRDLTLSALLRHHAALRPQAEALVVPAFAHGGRAVRLSFAQLDARVDALARGLLALGLDKGRHVAVWGHNVPDWVPLQFALARIGAVLVTVNTALAKDEVAYVLRQSKAVAVIHTTRNGGNESARALDELLSDASRPLPRLAQRVWMQSLPDEEPPLGTAPGGGRGALLSLAALVERGAGLPADELAAREASCAPGDVVNIQYTSGTTGFPKGVMLSHRNILGSGATLGAQLGLTPADRVALFVPLFHCFGCVVAVLGAYAHGAAVCAIPSFEAGAALRLIEEERCTILHGVPTMFSAMMAHESLPGRRITTLRAGLMAGAPCPVPLMQRVIDTLRCPGLAVTYGLTEASPGVSGSLPDEPLAARCETIGRPLPGVEVRLVDPATRQDVAHGEAGELWCRGDNIMVGYHDDPAATAAAVTPEGWLRTGDLCRLDEQGRLRIAGRIKDLIIRGGENIAPAEIENVLREHEDIVDAAVVGLPDDHFGEIVAAGLILREGARLDPLAYTALLRGRIAAFKIPVAWKAFPRFPLTGSGKVQKFKLRTLFDGALRGAKPA